jgi:hypothetical protein
MGGFLTSLWKNSGTQHTKGRGSIAFSASCAISLSVAPQS